MSELNPPKNGSTELPVTLYNKYQVLNMIVNLLDIYGNANYSEEYKHNRVSALYPNFSGFNVWGDSEQYANNEALVKFLKINFTYTLLNENSLYQVVYIFDSMGIEYEIYFVHTDKTGYSNHSLAEHGILL